MNTRKTIFILFILIQSAFTATVEEAYLRALAETWITSHPKGKTFEINNEITNPDLYQDLVLFQLSPKGFLLMSSDDAVQPILGYSFEHNFPDLNALPQHMISFIKNYQLQISEAQKSLQKPTQDVSNLWHELSNSSFQYPNNIATIEPFVPALWNQGSPYNEYCPADGNGNHTLVGCVAVAMAQAMSVYQHPSQGVGSHAYTHYNWGYLEADFGNTQYNWSQMPTNIAFSTPPLAEFLFHCGVAVEMDYGIDGSGAYVGWGYPNVVTSLKEHFDYSQNITFEERSDHSPEDWLAILRAELNARRPIVYRGYGPGGGHAFNFDGYDAMDYFHVNWGWGGSSNGYFYIGALNPGGLTFNDGNGAVLGIRPPMIARFETDEIRGMAPLSVLFLDLSVSDVAITSFQWDFEGDGVFDSSEEMPEFVYEFPGTYSPTLIISDGTLQDTIQYENLIEIYSYYGPTWHVSEIDGSDETGDGSFETPFSTLTNAVERSRNHDEIIVYPGRYYANLDFAGKQLNFHSIYSSTQNEEDIASTIIDGSLNGKCVVTFDSQEDSSFIFEGFTLTNGTGDNYNGGGMTIVNGASPVVRHCKIIENSSNNGGGLLIANAYPTVSNIEIRNNTAIRGGGLYIEITDVELNSFIVSENTASFYGGGIYIKNQANPRLNRFLVTDNIVNNNHGGGIHINSYSDPIFTHLTLTNNVAIDKTSGGVYLVRDCHPVFINSILYQNSDNEIEFSAASDTNTVTISHSIIEGAESGVISNDNGAILWLDGNLNNDPLFSDSACLLSENSPAIDRGATLVQVSDGFVWQCDESYSGTNPDMGYFESPYINPLSLGEPQRDMTFSLKANYPNPFNPSTVIPFSVGTTAHIRISVFDLKGREVALLMDKQLEPGEYQVSWSPVESHNFIANGLYLLRMETETYRFTQKILYLK